MLPIVLVFAMSGIPVTGQTAMDPVHVNAVENWRARHEADYTREYVPLAGLFFLKPGANTAGSAAGNDVRLPGRAPASAWTLRAERRVRLSLRGCESPSQCRRPRAAAPEVWRLRTSTNWRSER